MASNPIQRRARQSFLVGFLIALIIAAVIVVLLFMRISSLQTENAQLQAEELSVYIVNTDIKSGDVITGDMLTQITVRSSEFDTTSYLTSAYFYQVDDNGNDIEYIAKVDISYGAILTEEMVTESDNPTADDDRIVEYNMIVLPSQLQNGDYIDVRITFPNGEDYIVLSKKYVEQTTATAVWMEMSEIDILTLNSAIVEAYMIEGSRLYAVTYTEPGIQEAATATYAVNNDVLTAINADSNILEEARQDLAAKWSNASTDSGSDYSVQRNNTESYMSDMDDEDKASAVESGNSEENEAISTAREEYVAELDGTGLVGQTY